MLSSFRVSVIVECNENEFKDIPGNIPSFIHSYISCVTGKCLRNGVLTSDFWKLMSTFNTGVLVQSIALPAFIIPSYQDLIVTTVTPDPRK